MNRHPFPGLRELRRIFGKDNVADTGGPNYAINLGPYAENDIDDNDAAPSRVDGLPSPEDLEQIVSRLEKMLNAKLPNRLELCVNYTEPSTHGKAMAFTEIARDTIESPECVTCLKKLMPQAIDSGTVLDATRQSLNQQNLRDAFNTHLGAAKWKIEYGEIPELVTEKAVANAHTATLALKACLDLDISSEDYPPEGAGHKVRIPLHLLENHRPEDIEKQIKGLKKQERFALAMRPNYPRLAQGRIEFATAEDRVTSYLYALMSRRLAMQHPPNITLSMTAADSVTFDLHFEANDAQMLEERLRAEWAIVGRETGASQFDFKVFSPNSARVTLHGISLDTLDRKLTAISEMIGQRGR